MAHDRRITRVVTHSDHEWPFVSESYISHKADLSDLGEPYLSEVRRAILEEKLGYCPGELTKPKSS